MRRSPLALVVALVMAVVSAAVVSLLAPTPASAATATYYVWPTHTAPFSKCLDDPGFSLANNQPIDIWDCVGQVNERWYWVPVTIGTTAYVQAKNVYSGKCLTVLGGGSANGTAIVQYTCTTANTNGLWRAGGSTATHKWGFVNPASGKCLDVAGSGTANGTRLVLWSCNGGANQRFQWVDTTSIA